VIDLIQADLTTLDVDAIVNAANSALSGGGGVDGAIHRAAGPELLAACRALGRCPTGQAVRTPGFRLKARWVIHAVGPVWEGGGRNEAELLASAYQASFARALEEPTIRTVAFPSISTGVYGFPISKAAPIALAAMRKHEPQFERIVACLFSEKDLAVYRSAM
jgi:O-acetyl-ADP-ribose deacetylase